MIRDKLVHLPVISKSKKILKVTTFAYLGKGLVMWGQHQYIEHKSDACEE